MGKSDDVYAAQGFGQRIGMGRQPALLVIDFTEGFVDPAQYGGGNIAAALENTLPVLELCRSRGLPVIFTRIVYAADGSDCGIWCRKIPSLRELVPEAPANRFPAALSPRPEELVVDKRQASAFLGTGLADLLAGHGIDTLLVAGCTTSGCVRASVVDAVGYDFRPIVLSDCVGDRALGPHEANLFDMGQKYADLCRAADLPALLEAAHAA